MRSIFILDVIYPLNVAHPLKDVPQLHVSFLVYVAANVSFSLLPFSRNSRRVYRGKAFLQQPGCGGESVHATSHECLPLQKGHRDLQLQLLEQHSCSTSQQTGKYNTAVLERGTCHL